MSDELKQQLDAELSHLIREYQERGLDPATIRDSLSWHTELARARDTSDTDERKSVLAD